MASLHETYGDQVQFIHLEPFDLAIARSEGRLAPTPAFEAWGLQTEPWVFVIDSAGVVSARFEGLVGAPEIEAALRARGGLGWGGILRGTHLGSGSLWSVIPAKAAIQPQLPRK